MEGGPPYVRVFPSFFATIVSLVTTLRLWESIVATLSGRSIVPVRSAPVAGRWNGINGVHGCSLREVVVFRRGPG
jgi:hypothetical protein